jgi:hypothetical protein
MGLIMVTVVVVVVVVVVAVNVNKNNLCRHGRNEWVYKRVVA